jgi:hypothetical protein
MLVWLRTLKRRCDHEAKANFSRKDARSGAPKVAGCGYVRAGASAFVSHEDSAPEGSHVNWIELEPFSIFAFGLKSPVPVALNAGRVVSLDGVDRACLIW